MIEAVLLFAALTAAFELVIFAKLSPRIRLRVLNWPGLVTAVAFAFNLWVHWGTITGSMTAVTAGMASMAVTAFGRWYWGYIDKGKYIVGQRKFTIGELK